MRDGLISHKRLRLDPAFAFVPVPIRYTETS
jgi:hypothetical protein